MTLDQIQNALAAGAMSIEEAIASLSLLGHERAQALSLISAWGTAGPQGGPAVSPTPTTVQATPTPYDFGGDPTNRMPFVDEVPPPARDFQNARVNWSPPIGPTVTPIEPLTRTLASGYGALPPGARMAGPQTATSLGPQTPLNLEDLAFDAINPQQLALRSQAGLEDRLGENRLGLVRRMLTNAPGFLSLPSTMQDALARRAFDLSAQYNLSQVANPDQGFGQFLSARGTTGRSAADADLLRSQLTQLMGFVNMSPEALEALPFAQQETGQLAMDFRETPSLQVRAAIQPLMNTIAPDLRATFARNIERQYNNFMAQNPLGSPNQFLASVEGSLF